MRGPVVLKFGGACLLDPDDFAAVADYVQRRVGRHLRAVVVVSAMSGASGAISELMEDLNDDAPPAARALAMASADQLSAALLALTLDGLGVATRVLGPSQTGLVGAGYATHGRLIRCDGEPVHEALRTHQVVVVPGGHGTDEAGNPMMFGRNSSDLSAVALATAAGALRCEIFSDVPGVYTADPALVPEARPVPEASYRFAGDLTEGGAKVLHPDAVALARRHDLIVVFRGRPPGAVSLTTMSRSGTWRPAVTAHARGGVWSFPDAADAHSAREALRGQGLEALQSGHCLVVEPGVPRAALPVVRERGTETNLRLVTVLRGENLPPERHLVPDEILGQTVREHHRRLYPDALAPAALAPAALAAPRARSPYSRVLWKPQSRP